jgi:hypothetical protein
MLPRDGQPSFAAARLQHRRARLDLPKQQGGTLAHYAMIVDDHELCDCTIVPACPAEQGLQQPRRLIVVGIESAKGPQNSTYTRAEGDKPVKKKNGKQCSARGKIVRSAAGRVPALGNRPRRPKKGEA